MSLDVDAVMKETAVGIITDPSFNDISVYKEPLNENVYVFMDNAYHGLGGFRDGTYLTPHRRELFYSTRRQISVYRNLIKPIFDAMVDPVFADVIPRTVEETSMFNDFLYDVDNNGMTMHTFMKEAMGVCVRHGQCFVIMDNFTASDMPETILEARANRLFPYLILKTAADVDHYDLDKWGNIQSIIFCDNPVMVNKVEEKRYRKWDKEFSYVLKKTGDNKYEVLEKVQHGLGRIPVIVAYRLPRIDKQKLCIDPPHYDMARYACGIYNEDSEARDLRRNQAFSLLVIQTDHPGNINIGKQNVLFIPSDTQLAPVYISPDFTISTGFVEIIGKSIDTLYRMAEQSGVTAVKVETSGVAESYRFQGHENLLRVISMIAKSLDEAIYELFNLYTNESQDYSADYPTDFQPTNVNAEATSLESYIKLTPPPKAKALALKKLTRLLLADQDEKELQESLDEIDEEATEPEEGSIKEPDTGMTGMMGDTGMNGETGMNDQEESTEE